MMRCISRSAWRTISSARIILIPPPVDPEQVVKQQRNSIQIGAKIGHWSKSVLENPVVVAMETTLNALKRNAVQKFEYTSFASRKYAMPATEKASTAR